MNISIKHKWMVTGVAILVSATVILFPPFRLSAQKKIPGIKVQEGDTAAGKRKPNSVDRDDWPAGIEPEILQKSMEAVQQAMEHLQKHDMAKLQQALSEAMTGLELAQQELKAGSRWKQSESDIRESVESAMKSFDVQEMKSDLDAALKEVDWKKIHETSEEAMKEAMVAVKEARKLNMDQMKLAMEQAHVEMEQAHRAMKEQMHHAQIQMEQANGQLASIKKMRVEMEKDGLIKANEPLNIQWENGKLILNGKEQPSNISDKYKKYNRVEKGDRDDEDEIL